MQDNTLNYFSLNCNFAFLLAFPHHPTQLYHLKNLCAFLHLRNSVPLKYLKKMDKLEDRKWKKKQSYLTKKQKDIRQQKKKRLTNGGIGKDNHNERVARKTIDECSEFTIAYVHTLKLWAKFAENNQVCMISIYL